MFDTLSVRLLMGATGMLLIGLLCLDVNSHPWVTPTAVVLTLVMGLAPALDLVGHAGWSWVDRHLWARWVARRESRALWRRVGMHHLPATVLFSDRVVVRSPSAPAAPASPSKRTKATNDPR